MSIEEDIANFLAAGGAVTILAPAKTDASKKANDGSIEESAERNAEYSVGEEIWQPS